MERWRVYSHHNSEGWSPRRPQQTLLHRQGQGLLSPVLLPGRGVPAGEAPLKYNRQCGSLAASCVLDHGPDRTGTYTAGARWGFHGLISEAWRGLGAELGSSHVEASE